MWSLLFDSTSNIMIQINKFLLSLRNFVRYFTELPGQKLQERKMKHQTDFRVLSRPDTYAI